MESHVIGDDKRKLFEDAQNGCKLSLNTLYKEHENLVYLITKKYLIINDSDDILQVGKMSLLKSILNFDLSKNVKFSTYAYPSIEGEIKRYFRDNKPMKIGRKISEQTEKIRQYVHVYERTYMNTPSIQDIENGTGITKEEIGISQEVSQPFVSLYTPIQEDDKKESLLVEIIRDSDKDPYEQYLEKDSLYQAMLELSPKERSVLYFRYFKEELQTEVAEKLGISQVHVSRLEKRALNKIKEQLLIYI